MTRQNIIFLKMTKMTAEHDPEIETTHAGPTVPLYDSANIIFGYRVSFE